MYVYTYKLWIIVVKWIIVSIWVRALVSFLADAAQHSALLFSSHSSSQNSLFCCLCSLLAQPTSLIITRTHFHSSSKYVFIYWAFIANLLVSGLTPGGCKLRNQASEPLFSVNSGLVWRSHCLLENILELLCFGAHNVTLLHLLLDCMRQYLTTVALPYHNACHTWFKKPLSPSWLVLCLSPPQPEAWKPSTFLFFK